MDINPLLAKRLLKLARDLLVFEWHGARQHFEHRHLGAEAVKDGGELHAHCARADNDQRFRDLAQVQDFAVGQDGFAVSLHARQQLGFRARGQDDVLRHDLPRLAFRVRHADSPGARQSSKPLNELHTVLLQQEFHAFGQLLHDLGLARLDRRPIQADTGADDSIFLGILEVVVDFSVQKQRLRRNATDVEAGSAVLIVLLNEGGFHSQLSGTNRRDIAPRPAANDHDVVVRSLCQVRHLQRERTPWSAPDGAELSALRAPLADSVGLRQPHTPARA